MEAIQVRSPEKIPGSILQRRDITLSAKRVYSQISYSQAHSSKVSLSMGWIASRLGLARQTVSRAVAQLEEQHLLKVLHQSRYGSIFSITRQPKDKKFFLFLNSNNSGHSESEKLILEYLHFRQGKKDAAWPHQQTIADDLGMTKRSVQNILNALEKDGKIQVRHAHGGLKQGNKYRLTTAAFPVPILHPKSESGAKSCNTYNNTTFEVKENNNNQPSKSAEIIKSQSILQQQGVAHPVATALARQHTAENIENAVINSAAQEQLAAKSGKKFNRAGYVVTILNKTDRKFGKVQLNRYAKLEVEKRKAAGLRRMANRDERGCLDPMLKASVMEQLQAHKEAMANGTAKSNVPDSIKRLLGVA